MTVQVSYVPLDDLTPADRNPKLHDLEAIRASFRRFGFVAPVLVDESSGQVLAGHGRLEALRSMLLVQEPAPDGVHVTGGEHGEVWRVPVVRGIRFANPAAAEAYLVADNRLTERGGWEEGQLLTMLDDLAELGALEDTGFDGDFTDDLRARLDAVPTSSRERFGGGYAETEEETAAREAEAAGRGPAEKMRELVLLYKPPEYEAFRAWAEALAEVYGVTGVTATVLAAVVDEAENGAVA